MAGEPTKTVRNERTKLTATLLNGVAIASVVAGVITPLAALSFGLGSTSNRTTIAALLISFAWPIVGLSLHIVARGVLGEASRMTGNDIFLLFLGPILALSFGLFVYFLFGRPNKQPHNF